MNHIYKVIWNTVTQTWVAVSELSRAKGKTKSSKTLSAVVLAAVSAGAIVGDAEAAIVEGQGDGISIQSQNRNTKVAKAEGVTAIAIGYDVSSKGTSALAIGMQTQATGEKTVAIGHLSKATGSESTALGVKAEAKGNGDIALGKHAVAQGGANGVTGSAALGDEAKATGAQSAAVGGKSNASGSHAVASGYNTQATGDSSSAIGDAAEASGNQATAVGVSSEAKGNQSAALGMAAHAHGNGSIAAGVASQATQAGTTAIGGWTEATAEKATAVGDSAHANANQATALGHNAQATGEFSTATGVSSRASGSASVATGKNATASGNNAIATGNASNAAGEDSIASGRQASATGTGAIATGAEASASGNAAAYGNKANATGGWSSAFGNESKATATDASAFGNSANAGGVNSTAIGSHSTVTANNGSALGNYASVSAEGGVALGQGSASTRAALDGKSITINSEGNVVSSNHITDKDNSAVTDVYAPVRLINDKSILERVKNTIKGTAGAVSLGNDTTTRQLTNLAPGSADSDAVNVAQLKAVVSAFPKYSVVGENGVTVKTDPENSSDPRKWKVSIDPSYVKNLTKWQIRDTNTDGNPNANVQNTDVTGGDVVTFQDTDTIDVERDGKTLKFHTKKNIKYFSVNSSGGGNENNNGATATDAIAIGKDASSTGSNAVSLGFGAKALGANNTAIGAGAQAKDVRTTAVGYNATAEAASAVGIGYEAHATQSRSLAIGQDATASANNAIALGSSGQQSGTDRPNKTTASAEHAVAIGSGAVANIANGIALGSQSKTTADKGQTGFDASQDVEGARTNKYDNLKNNVQNVRTSTLAGLSIGDTGKTRQINHLAAGTADDDAVNVAQLKSVNLAFKGDNNTKGDVRLHDQRLSVVGATDSFITTKASDNKLEINTTKSNELQFTAGAANNITTPTGLTTDKAVANAINNSGWTLQAGDKTVGLINPGDKVNIASGKGITVTSTPEANNISKITINATVAGIKAGHNVTVKTTDGVSTINAIDTNTQASVSKLNNNSPITIDSSATNAAGAKDYKLDVNVDDKTISKAGGTLHAVTGAIEEVTANGTGTNAPKKGQVKAKSGDDSKVTTVENVANMINSAKWFAKASNTTDEVTDANKTDDADNADGQAMSAGDKLTLKAGKNLRVKRDGADFTFALNNTVDLTDKGSLTIGNTKVNNDGITITPAAGKSAVTLTANGLDNGGNKIVNVAAGKDDTDAVNVKQLKDSISTEKVKAAEAKTGDENIATVTPAENATGYGEKNTTYEVSVTKSAVKNIAKTAVKVVNGKNTTVTPGDDETDNSKTYAVDVKGNLTDITSITNTAGSGKVEFAGDGVVNITDGNNTGNHPIKLDGKTGDITGLTNTTLGGNNFAKSGRAATEEQLKLVDDKFDNKVSLGGNSGETNKKALSTAGGIKFNVKAADDNKVVTTEATGDDVNIKFSGEEAAKVTNLSYKANKGTAKKVTLENGLDFTNGTHTTAEVDDNGVVKFNVNTAKVDVPTTQPDTFTGKFDAPTTDGVATIKNVVDVVNNSGWKISQGADSRGIVKAGDEVSFVGTGGTTVKVEGTSGKRTVTVSSTLGDGEKGEITAVTKENKAGTEKVGQVKPKSEEDKTKVTTVKNVADMINSAKWFAKADNSEEDLAETKNDNGEAVNAGSELTFKAGKNLHVNRTNGVFTFALDSALKDLTSTTYKNGGNTVTVSADTNGDLHISKLKPGSTTNETVDAKITGVAKGTEDNDAVNVKQLKSTERHITPTTYTYNDTDKSVTLTYTDGNGNLVKDTNAKIDLSGLASKIKDYSFKTNATGSNLVGTGTDTTVASGKSVNFAASDNLTLKQDVNDGNVTYTYGLKNQVVVGEKGTPGADGKPGKDGIDGSIGVNGQDGSAIAINGKDGSIGLNGKDGKNGLTIKGQDGKVGVDGKDGETRLVYVEKADPTKPESSDKTHELATLDDGMKYGGDIGEVANVKLNKQVDIKGGVTDKTKLSDNNIGVISTPNATTGGTELTVKLAKELKGLTSAEFKGGDNSTVTNITNSGITIKPANSNDDSKTVSLTDTGLNNGGNKITNVAEGKNDTDAVNVKQLKDFKSEVAEGGLTFAGNSGTAHKAKLNTTVNIKGGEGI